MTGTKRNHFRDQLRTLAERVGATAAALEDQVRTPTGGESAGGISNVPMHLGDVGSEVYTQELNATLLENEAHIREEVQAALDRVDAATFGTCEACGKPISEARLEALPYARHCVKCATKLQAGVAVNLNDGRPEYWEIGLDGADTDGATANDVHAAGTPGGGGPDGGLAGTTAGRGDPGGARLEAAMGSSNYDEEQEDDDEDDGAHAGRAGGAVGGTPANKRAGTRKRAK